MASESHTVTEDLERCTDPIDDISIHRLAGITGTTNYTRDKCSCLTVARWVVKHWIVF